MKKQNYDIHVYSFTYFNTYIGVSQEFPCYIARNFVLCKKLYSFPNLSTVTSNNFNYHFLIENGIAYIAVFPVTYPKKLAFLFLNDICKQFNEELMIQYGTHSIDYRSIIETIEKPYSFIKFDRKITKIKQEYKDPRSNIAIKKLNESLNEVSSIMKKNIDDILMRGENLEDVGRKAFNLKYESEKFKKVSRVLNLKYALYQYGILASIVIFFFLIIIFKNYF
ncbi:hypothetical protein PFTANZ_00649 [Plasmodium falciparum Tanzania (2000708)]|uniref:Longin domain-containing protein n=1 Tax=Plasmodium falciparum Tanzania (2000708) TaxID=1036725 RepID=A0A024WCK6_PLAFA|nr:hypothetical protein PFTANZ_00649 [Plasmodium falciparum Tanzania (2000708)]